MKQRINYFVDQFLCGSKVRDDKKVDKYAVPIIQQILPQYYDVGGYGSDSGWGDDGISDGSYDYDTYFVDVEPVYEYEQIKSADQQLKKVLAKIKEQGLEQGFEYVTDFWPLGSGYFNDDDHHNQPPNCLPA